MRKDEVVTGEAHCFLSKQRKPSWKRHHRCSHDVLVACDSLRTFGHGKCSRVSSLTLECLRQLHPSIQKRDIFSPEAKEAAVSIIFQGVFGDLQFRSRNQLSPLATPRVMEADSREIGICAQRDAACHPVLKKSPGCDKGDVRICVKEGRNVRVFREEFARHKRLVITKVAVRVALEKVDLAPIQLERFLLFALELISPRWQFIPVSNENGS